MGQITSQTTSASAQLPGNQQANINRLQSSLILTEFEPTCMVRSCDIMCQTVGKACIFAFYTTKLLFLLMFVQLLPNKPSDITTNAGFILFIFFQKNATFLLLL